MKKIISFIMVFSVICSCFSFVGTPLAKAAVGDYTMSESESNNSQSSADRIYDDYTVNGEVSGNDMDFYKFTLSSKSTVSIITVANYKSCFLAGIVDSSDNALAASNFVEYSSSGYPTYLTSVTLNAGTYYYVVLNRDASTLRNVYTFHFSYSAVTPSHSHTYSNACDTSCNTCGATRSVSHTYSNACDTSCNVCGKTRTAEKHKITSYTFTNATTYPFSLSDGVYSSTNTANSSSSTAYITATRDGSIKFKYYTSTEADYDKLTVKHNNTVIATVSGSTSWVEKTIDVVKGDKIYFTYSKDSSQSAGLDKVYFSIDGGDEIDIDNIKTACFEDVVCSICNQVIIKAGTHNYSSGCYGPCSECGEVPEKALHIYDNNCDKSCNVCGETRTVGSHKYTNACDTTCNYCKAKRTIKHSYSNSCDSNCNVCDSKRSVTHSYKSTTTKATLSKNGKITKKCTVCGKSSTTTTIYYPKTIKLSTTTYSYDGKVKSPSVTVKDSSGKKLKKDTDYTVTYASGRKNVGKYKVTVKMKGKYSGTKTLYITINPAPTKISSVTAGKKSLKVNITKKTTQTSGYQIQYATNSSFKSAKTITIKKNTTTYYTIKDLATKNYYIRVRTFKTLDGKNYYSSWSSSKKQTPSHTHSYSKATCTKAKTCKYCNITSGSALGHSKNTVKCTRCGKTLFNKLTYSGTGIGKISNINIPSGDFILELVATGLNSKVIDNCFVTLYDGEGYTRAYAGVTVSVPLYGWSSSEKDPFEGPIKKGTIKVDTADDIKWEITITPY